MAAGSPLWEDDIYNVAVDNGMLPDPARETSVSWGRIRTSCPRAKESKPLVDKYGVVSLLAHRDKKVFEEGSEVLWPYRSKVDKTIRRTRLLDYVILFRETKREEELVFILTHTREGWDVIFVTNLCVATFVFGFDWYRRWYGLGAFDSDISHFTDVAKYVHNIAKSTGLADPNWTWYVECANLVGYRNPPFPGFDVMKEGRALAEGGEIHEYFGYEWKSLVKDFLPMGYKPVEFMTFDDFVKKGDWLTTGASSVGRVEIELPDGKTKRIKARKNMVADVVDLGQLAVDARAAVGQVNTTIVKSELGKLRLAVAGDIYTYLKMTWVNYLLGGAYYDWPGNTSEEDFVEQTKRLSKMLALCAVKLGLPYDYAGFDHQPTTQELVTIVQHLMAHARLNVPPLYLQDFDSIADNIVGGFYRSVLVTRDGEQVQTLDVTGGLMSGLRWTSVLGNGWNSVMTGLCLKLLTDWGMDVSGIERFIRGDDSAIFAPNWATGAGMNIAYDAVGVKAGQGKFALRKGAMEFLRVWFDTRCRGYPARAIPGITQRKPWASNPWSEDMILKALSETCRTLRRRVSDRVEWVDKLWTGIKKTWCQNHSLPMDITKVPLYGGGLGLEPPDQGFYFTVEPPVPRVDMNKHIRILNQNTWRSDRIAQYAHEKYGLVVDSPELAHQELIDTITADNIPDVAVQIRRVWLDEVKSVRCKVTKHTIIEREYVSAIPVKNYPPDRVDDLLGQLKAECPLFGAAPEAVTARNDYARFRPEMTFRQWCQRYFPRVAQYMTRFHRSWHRSEVIDYLSGKISIAPTTIHPALVKILAWVTASQIRPASKAMRHGLLGLARTVERILCLSTLSQNIYWW